MFFFFFFFPTIITMIMIITGYFEKPTKSYTNLNKNNNNSLENLKQLVSRRNTSEPQLSNLNNIPVTINIPIVYPALLSQVATVFMKYVPVASYIKDSIKYTNCFRGSDAVVSNY